MSSAATPGPPPPPDDAAAPSGGSTRPADSWQPRQAATFAGPADVALPMRPLTVGEVLDAAVQLIRVRPLPLLATALGLALAEQAVLIPARENVGAFLEQDTPALSGGYWLVLALGAGIELFIIMLLGPAAGAAAIRDVVGTSDRTGRWMGKLMLTVMVIATVAAVLAGLGAVLGPLWIFGFAAFGLATVVATVERRGPFSALGRAAVLAVRGGGRATGIRLLGYLSWLILRFAFYLGMLEGLDLLELSGPERLWLVTGGLVLANATAYAALACLDAAVLIETRIRTEGLDLWLRRSSAHSQLTAQALVVSR